MIEVIQAIMTHFTNSDLWNDVGGRIFFDYVPEGTDFPYVVLLNIPDDAEDNFTDHFENYQVQFSLFSNSESATEINTMYGHLRTILDDAALSITGDTVHWCRRIGSPNTMTEEVTTNSGIPNVFHWAVDYQICVEE